MRQLKKETFKGLRDAFHVISVEELMEMMGGNDCVLQCYSYVSGHSVEWWANTVQYNFGYNVYEEGSGGLQTSDIVPLGAYGGLNVTDLGSVNTTQAVNSISQKLANGQTVMMTFNSSSGPDHAVIVTSVNTSTNTVHWYDPSTKTTGSQSQGQWSGFYSLN